MDAAAAGECKCLASADSQNVESEIGSYCESLSIYIRKKKHMHGFDLPSWQPSLFQQLLLRVRELTRVQRSPKGSKEC